MNWHATFVVLFIGCVTPLALGILFLPPMLIADDFADWKRAGIVMAALFVASALLAGLVWA